MAKNNISSNQRIECLKIWMNERIYRLYRNRAKQYKVGKSANYKQIKNK